MKYAAKASLAGLLLIAACAQSSPVLNPPAAEFGFAVGPLPQGGHLPSATEVIDGVDYEAIGEGTTPEPPALLLDGTELTCSWALYGFGLPEEGVFNGVALDVEDVNGQYWVGLADYWGSGTWEWHGPYTDDATANPTGDSGNYVSPSDNVYWALIAPLGCSLKLVSSTVDYDAPAQYIYHAPPADTHVAAYAPALSPSLTVLPEVLDIAEEGAPVIFYTSDDGGPVDTYVSYYDGEEWQRQLLFPDGPRLTHAVARLVETGTPGFLVAAYDPAEDESSVYLLDYTLTLVIEFELRGEADGTLAALAMDCLDADNWCTAEVRRTGEGDTLVANYEDAFDYTKDPYVHALPGEQVAGLDALCMTEERMIVFSHGTIDLSDLVLLDFELGVVTVTFNDWTLVPADYNAPLTLDLGTDSAGNPQLLFTSGHDWHSPLPPPYDFSATLYYDIVLGTHNGSTWDYEPLYEGDLVIHFISSEIDLSAGVDASWASADALSYSAVEGTVGYTLTPEFGITGGLLSNGTDYLVRDGGSFVPSSYYGGGAGLSFSWDGGAHGSCCAYISVEEVDIEDLLGGQTDASGDLMYWSPAAL